MRDIKKLHKGDQVTLTIDNKPVVITISSIAIYENDRIASITGNNEFGGYIEFKASPKELA